MADQAQLFRDGLLRIGTEDFEIVAVAWRTRQPVTVLDPATPPNIAADVILGYWEKGPETLARFGFGRASAPATNTS